MKAARKLKGIPTMASAAFRNPIVNQRIAITRTTPESRLFLSTAMRAETHFDESQVTPSSMPAGTLTRWASIQLRTLAATSSRSASSSLARPIISAGSPL
jgi:hypothetical protein